MRWAYGLAVACIVAFLLADVWFEIDYQFWADVSLLAVAVLVLIFTAQYLGRSRWWTNRIGKVYLTKSVVLSLVLVQIAVALWWDTDYPFRQHIRFAIYALCAVAYVPMIATLWREQQRDRRRRSSVNHDRP
ncbi:putative phage holin [Mycobacterium sp. LTG2003]